MATLTGLRGITISIGYAECLEITLVRNMRHFARCVVITSPEDEATQRVARSVPGVQLVITDAFRRYGARFNKGLCFEEAWDTVGRDGWWLIWDADILLPDAIPTEHIQPDQLHGARRRLLKAGPAYWRPDLEWDRYPVHRDGGPIGFFQLFHADAIAGKRPWYDVTFSHAGGGDAYFMTHWPRHKLCVLPMEVLHLGDNDRNWFGVDPEGQDLMAAFVIRNGWTRAAAKHDARAIERVGEIVERVEVPGYDPTGFELPFVARAKARASKSP
jgi:hypothetical protein